MNDPVFNLGLAILIALFGSVIALRLRLHPIAGLLLLGFLAGPGVLEIIQEDDLTSFIAHIGAILLLFGIGLEVKIENMLRKGLRAVIIGIAKIAFVFAIVYETALLMGFGLQEALLLGSMLCITSTAIFAVLSKNNRDIDRNLLLTVLLLEDIFAIMVLSAIPELAGDAAMTGLERFLVFIFSFLAILVGYFVIRHILLIAIPFFIESGDRNSLLFASLALCLMLSVSVEAIGLDAAIGAFMAGNIMASVRNESEIQNTIKPFTAVFSSFFFLSIGMEVQLSSLAANPLPVIVFTLFSILGKLAGTAGSMYLLGARGIPAIETGIYMISTGEFSLLIAQNASSALAVDLVTVVGSVVFLSTVASSLITMKSESLAIWITEKVPQEKRHLPRQLAAYFSQVVAEFEPRGRLYELFKKDSLELLSGIFKLLLFSLAAFVLFRFNPGEPFNTALDVFAVLLAIIGIVLEIRPIIVNTIEIIRGIDHGFMLAYGRYEELDRKMMTRSTAVLVCVLGGVALTFLFSFLMLPDIYYYFAWFLYVLACVFMVELLLTMRQMAAMKSGRKKRTKI